MLNRKKRIKENAKRVQKHYNSITALRRNEIRKHIQGLKGKLVYSMFTCDLCGHQHTKGYQYSIEDKDYMICEFCNNSIFHKHQYLKIQYTPMGNKR